MTQPAVGIIGGGASGILVAAAILRSTTTPISLYIFEPRTQLGLGIAYSTSSPLHTLNVRAKAMSAVVGDAEHFVRWSGLNRESFASRAVYGQYLQELLHDAASHAISGANYIHICDSVVDVQLRDGLVEVQTKNNELFAVDKLVLATGNELPTVPIWLQRGLLSHPRVLVNPWQDDALKAITTGTVVAVGTGLTFVDVAMSVLEQPTTSLVGLSRHGLMPTSHTHVNHPPELPILQSPREVLHWLREDKEHWRERVNGLRTITQQLWQGFSDTQRKQFLRLAVRYWDIHRHRIAEETASLLDGYFQNGRLSIKRGEVVGLEVQGNETLLVRLGSGEAVSADWVVICTGPSEHATHNNPPIASLIRQGVVTSGVFNFGLHCNPVTGAVIGENDEQSDQIYAVGPLRKGELWESIAIPEIHVQAQNLGALLVSHQ
jgi:uncharacterized NAD(P)/FAD-binding protein YdhS